MSATTDFSYLPEVVFTERDTGKVESAIITMYEGLTKTVLYDGDPVRLFLLTLAAVISQRNVDLDYTGKQNLLRYAQDDFLDHIGAMLDVPRLAPSFAEDIQRFTVANPVGFNVPIPKGTRVTPDAQLFFSTKEMAVLPAGVSYVDVPIAAMTAGTEANGLVPGQITRLVDPLDVVVTVSNLNGSSGGADREDDESYRHRIHIAPEKFSTAGPDLAYVYWALSAHPNIGDVSVHSPTPGVVKVYVLLKGGIIPDPDGPEIKAVRETLSAEKVRPLTDMVEMLPAEPVALDYRFTFYVTSLQAGYVDALKASVSAADREYRAWQTGRIGRDVTPDELYRVCRAAGAKRIVPERVLERDGEGNVVNVEPMAFISLAANQIAQVPDRDDRVLFGAVEDE